MKHPTLGELVREPDSGTVTGSVTVGERSLKLNVELDGEPLEAVLEYAAAAVGALPRVIAHGDTALGRDLLETYNGGWNTYDVQRGDGSTETIENPKLSAAEFVAKLVLDSIEVLGCSSVTLDYQDPEELFWGHHVYVEFVGGLEAQNATAAFAG